MFDVTNAADLLALKTEINTDPNGYGYVPEATQTVLDLINLARPAFTQENASVSSEDIKSLTTFDAYDGLGIDKQEWIRWRTSGDDAVKVTPDLRTQLAGDGTTSMWAVADRAAMIAVMLGIIDREGSRAEDLFGKGTTISRSDWIAARESI